MNFISIFFVMKLYLHHNMIQPCRNQSNQLESLKQGENSPHRVYSPHSNQWQKQRNCLHKTIFVQNPIYPKKLKKSICKLKTLLRSCFNKGGEREWGNYKLKMSPYLFSHVYKAKWKNQAVLSPPFLKYLFSKDDILST